MFDEYQLGLYEGKMNEQDRIIALLEERAYPEHDDEVVICEPLDHIIALIKGENNG